MDIEIRSIKNEFVECASLIRSSFITVAEEFNITKDNAPSNAAFIEADSLVKMKEKGIQMFGAYRDGKLTGFVAIEKADEDNYYMEKLAVLPENRHNGYGAALINFVFDFVEKAGGRKVSIGIINENRKLKDFYTRNGFVETGIRKFEHLPFEVCFMEKII